MNNLICNKCNINIDGQTVYCNSCGYKNNPSQLDNWLNVHIDVDGLNLNTNPLSWKQCKDMGTIAFSKNNYYEAIEYFEEALKFVIQNLDEISNIYNELAICFGKIGDLSKYMIYLNLAISANGNNNIALTNRAALKLNQKDDEGAIKDFEKLIKLNKMDSSLWQFLGFAFENSKQYENARVAYQSALSLGNNNAAKDLENILLKIKRIQ